MAMKTRFSGRDEAQVQAMAKEANRPGSRKGDPQNLGEHLNEISLKVPAALEGNFSKAAKLRRERMRCHHVRFLSLHPSLYITHAASSSKDRDGIVGYLKMKVQTLKCRCDGYEKVIKDLTSQCDMHENALEMLQQQIVHYLDSQATLSMMYHGNYYDLMS